MLEGPRVGGVLVFESRNVSEEIMCSKSPRVRKSVVLVENFVTISE